MKKWLLVVKSRSRSEDVPRAPRQNRKLPNQERDLLTGFEEFFVVGV